MRKVLTHMAHLVTSGRSWVFTLMSLMVLMPVVVSNANDTTDVPVKIHIVGFGMSPEDRAILEQAALEGGASFEHVQDVQGLDTVMGGISGSDVFPVLSAEAEPNDRFGHANNIAPAGAFTGSIHPKGDSDWLRFRVGNQGQLRVVSQQVPSDIDLTVRLWNANRDVQASWINAPAQGGVLDAIMDIPSAGEYTLELRDGRNDVGNPQPYQIDLEFIATADSGEANNKFGTASPLPIDADIRANILPKGDADFYAIEISEQGQLEVTVGEVAEHMDICYRIWNSNKDVSHNWISPLAKGGETHGLNDLSGAGRYVIEVRDGNNDARSPDPYHFKLNFQPTQDLGEPNNRFGHASDYAIGDAISSTILPKGDSDWYRVTVGNQGQLDVAIDPVPEALDVCFRVWNTNRDVMVNWMSPLSKGGPNHQIVDLPAPGSYVFEVRDGRNDARSIEPYGLKMDFQRTDDLGEPNNRFGSASLITLGSRVSANILPKGDSDWYRFDMPSAGNIEVSITNVDSELDIAFRVWNANRDVVNNWVAPLAKGGDTVGSVAVKEAGRYVLEVRDGRNDGRSIQPYQLSVTMSGNP